MHDTHGARCDTRDSVVLDLYRLALAEARRVHLNEHDACDCAMEMVLRALQQIQQVQQAEFDDTSAGICAVRPVLRTDLQDAHAARWLRRCARNFALSFRRDMNTRQGREILCESGSGNADDNGGNNYDDHDNQCFLNVVAVLENTPCPSAEDDALSRLFRQDVYVAVHELSPHARALFARFHLDGDTFAEIASSSGKSENAVKQSVYRTRQQVRESLVIQGYGSHGGL